MIGNALDKMISGLLSQSFSQGQADHYYRVSLILRVYRDELPRNGYLSFMKERFHPVPKPQWVESSMETFSWFSKKCGNDLCDIRSLPLTPVNLDGWLDRAKSLVGIIGISGYVKTSDRKERFKRNKKPGVRKEIISRKTCCAKFQLIPHREMVRRGTPFSYQPDRVRAIKFLSKVEGRMRFWRDSYVTSRALPVAKVGLVPFLVDLFVNELNESMAPTGCVPVDCDGWDLLRHRLPATYSLLVICCSVFSERKMFTLKSQKQGGLNIYMKQLLDIILEKEQDGLKIVALFLPLEEVYSKLSKETVDIIYNTSMELLGEFSVFIEQQWGKGVRKCVNRLCRVPPRGTKVNSSGFNAVADAWNNLRRFQTISAKYAKVENAPIILKVMQLIADDQFRMAGGIVNVNALVYKEITNQGILPWNAILHQESFDTRKVLTTLLDSCKKHKCSFDSWVGIAKRRSAEISKPVDMICGCAVPPMSTDCADFLKGIGLFGATPWKGN